MVLYVCPFSFHESFIVFALIIVFANALFSYGVEIL